MKRIVLLNVFLLAACAHDNYVAIPNGPGSQSRMKADLASCKDEALRKYQQANRFAGLGAIGGALDSGHPDSDPFHINPNIERCMREHGYAGTSRN